MAIHLNEVGEEARNIFIDVRHIGKRVLDRFYEGFAAALKDVHKGWNHLKPQERKIVFEKVQDIAKELIVDVNDGGGAKDGLALGTFYGYVCKVKRALIYHVSIPIAEKATNQELQKADKYRLEVLRDISGTREEKMEKAYEWVKGEQVKEKQRLKEEAEKLGDSKKAPSLNTPFTLPSPDDYEAQDTAELLDGGIKGILAWLQSKAMQPHLKKPLESAKLLKQIYGELLVHESSEQAEKAVA